MNEQIERDELLGLYSDMFKDANGFRPTGCLWPDALSNEEIQAKLDNLQEDIRRQIEEERYAEEEEERYQEEQDAIHAIREEYTVEDQWLDGSHEE